MDEQDGAADPVTGDESQILFAPADVDFYRAEGAKYAPDELHNAARRELNRWIRKDVVGDTDPDDHAVRFPWKPYVAMHHTATELVGPGIVAFEANFIAGTPDSNRSGQPRLDFVIRHTNGGYWRIHPGAKPNRDALPRYFAPALARTHLAADQWRHLRPQGFTYNDALAVPQIDRLSKKDAWAALENLPLGQLDSAANATFTWWLWLANLGPHTQRTLGPGVTGAALTFSTTNDKRIACRRIDDSVVEIQFSRKQGITIVEQ